MPLRSSMKSKLVRYQISALHIQDPYQWRYDESHQQPRLVLHMQLLPFAEEDQWYIDFPLNLSCYYQ